MSRLFALLFIFAFGPLQGESTAFETFRDTQGRSIEARILAVNGEFVDLERADGYVFKNAPIERFDAEGRRRIAEWARRNVQIPSGALVVEISKRRFDRDEDYTESTHLETEKVAYAIALRNRAATALPALQVEYRVYWIDERHGASKADEIDPQFITESETIATLAGGAETAFETQPVELTEGGLRGGWTYTNSDLKNREKDKLLGIHVRVRAGERIVEEAFHPPSLDGRFEWKE